MCSKTHWAGRSPQEVEDQVTYPIVTAMLGAPDIDGRFFYNEAFDGFNFERQRLRLDAVVKERTSAQTVTW